MKTIIVTLVGLIACGITACGSIGSVPAAHVPLSTPPQMCPSPGNAPTTFCVTASEHTAGYFPEHMSSIPDSYFLNSDYVLLSPLATQKATISAGQATADAMRIVPSAYHPVAGQALLAYVVQINAPASNGVLEWVVDMTPSGGIPLVHAGPPGASQSASPGYIAVFINAQSGAAVMGPISA